MVKHNTSYTNKKIKRNFPYLGFLAQLAHLEYVPSPQVL